MEKPFYDHEGAHAKKRGTITAECGCKFLGHVYTYENHRIQLHDVWLHHYEGRDDPSLIVRHSSEPEDHACLQLYTALDSPTGNAQSWRYQALSLVRRREPGLWGAGPSGCF